tara:strand:- start:261 stop:554 length:294 start_codon:yes stop_codon:yes gene_type:complete
MTKEQNYPDPGESRGGVRENSANLHMFKKQREFVCYWCSEKFTSIQAKSRFCCTEHRVLANRIDQAIKKKRKLIDIDRRGPHVRPMSKLNLNQKTEG